MKHVYAYTRVSTVKQGEKGSSLTEQRASIEAYAMRHDLVISEWFEEQETAAKHGRAIFTRMLSYLLKGQAHGVIIHKIDRSARNLRDWAYLGELIDKGIEIHFAHESVDMRSRGGRLAADIQAVVAADFIRNLRDEVRKGFNGRLKQGLYPLPAPVGYEDKGGGLPKVPDPLMAPLVKRAFRLYATGQYNLRTLGKELFRDGLRNRRGGRVTRNGLSTLLNNEFYIGIIYIRRTGERFQGIHEPLIKKSEFDRVKTVLHGRTKNVGLKFDFLYRKSLRCLHCKYNLVAEKQKGIIYYRCHTSTCPRTCAREDCVNAQFRTTLKKIRLEPQEIASLESEFEYLERDKRLKSDEIRKSIELNIARFDTRLSRLTDAYIDRLIDKETFEERKRILLHERTGVRELLEKLSSGTDANRIRTKIFLELLKTLSCNVNHTNREEMRDLLKEATSNLQMDGRNLEVTWKNPFQVVASRVKSQYGVPYRDASRTEKRKPTAFATKLFDLVHKEKPPSDALGSGGM
ncbi:MAG: recombinase family protein [Acidimicrobiales bacterium]